VLKFRPPRAWTQTLLFETQRQMPAFGAQELCNLLWALAVLGLRPGADWFRDFEVQVRVKGLAGAEGLFVSPDRPSHEAGKLNAQDSWALTCR
jgi:hypothetical protein